MKFSRTRGYYKPKDKTVRSNFEYDIKCNLVRAGVSFEYETKRILYNVTHTYKPDFILPNGVIVEAKGLFEPSDRQKHLYIKEQHPELDIRFLFMRDQWLTNKRKQKYSTWCKKHGFKYHIGKMIPKEWIEETP